MTLSCESFDGCCFLDCLKNPTYIVSMNAILHVVLEPMATKVHGCYSAHFNSSLSSIDQIYVFKFVLY